MIRGRLRLPVAVPIAAALLLTACSDAGGQETPSAVAPPTTEVAVPAGPPTPDYSALVAPGSDLVPKRMAVSQERPGMPAWVTAQAAVQVAEVEDLQARHDFRFADALADSGITFRNYVTPDSASQFKPNHYDHGNGVAVADVDGDGWLDIYFVTQLGRNELWRNRGDGTFEDITDSAGVALEERVGSSAGFADLDNDGDQDLFATTIRYGNALFENSGSGTFSDITDASGLAYSGHSGSVDFFDYDNDGLLDVFVSNIGKFTTEEEVDAPANSFRPEEGKWYRYFVGLSDAFFAHVRPELAESSRLYHNDGDLRFSDVTTAAGVETDTWSGDAVPFDANGDGWTDLFVLNMQGHDQYFENQGGTGFTDRTMDVFPRTPWGSMGATILDYDLDGSQDLYVVDMHSDMVEDVSPLRDDLKSRMNWPEDITRSEGRSIWGNAFYRNTGAQYQEISDALGVETMWPWGVSAADVNADGYEDLFVASSMNAAFRYQPNLMLLNDAGQRFERTEYALGLEPRANGEAYKPWYSVDCTENPENAVCQGTGLTGVVDVWEAYGSRSSALVDLDKDGDLDVVTNDWNSEPQLLLSDLSERGGLNWIGVDLEGTSANRDGLGATVTVEVGGRILRQIVDGQSGYMSQSATPLYFGLGSEQAADRIVVDWPGGTSQEVAGPHASGTVVAIGQEP